MGVNDQMLDFQADHRVDLVRVSNAQEATLLAGPYRVADRAMTAQILAARDPGEMTALQLERLQSRLDEILAAQNVATTADTNVYVRDLAGAEAEIQESLLNRILKPLGLAAATVTVGGAAAAIWRTPMLGNRPREWMRQLFRNDRERVAQQLRASAAAGQTSREAANAIVGSQALRFTDGVRNTTRNSVRTTMQTLTTHGAAVTDGEVWQANDAVVAERWVAMLDGRTSAICRSLDGTIFPKGQGIRPPAHPNCRSGMAPIIPELEAIPGAPDKTILPSSVADRFDGAPPRALTYEDWLGGKSAKFQDRVLGPTRGKLFRAGEVRLDRFINDRGVQIPLPELRRRLPEAFEDAGL
ncbi:MAG: hypothetical protein GY778_28810 [bacterium]|nr:hypothetical protein [bacterium]